MTSSDLAAFGKNMLVLSKAFNEPLDDQGIRVDAYFDALSDLSIEQVHAAVRLSLRSCRFFPKPVELRELVMGTPDANADVAWGELTREIARVGYLGTPRFSDERTAITVREVWGSWLRLCETLPGEGPELVGWMKQFKSAWLSQDRRDLEKRLTAGTVHPDVKAFIASEQRRIAGWVVRPFPARKEPA